MKQILQIAIILLFLTSLTISCKKSLISLVSSGNNSGGTGTDSNHSPDSVSTYAGSGILGLVNGSDSVAQFAGPTGVAVDLQGNVYVLDAQNYVIRKITPAGQVSTLAGNGNQGFVNGPGVIAEFSSPNGIAVDAQGNVYVSEGMDDNYNRIREISPSGVVSTFAGRGIFGFKNGTGTASAFFTPAGMAFDAQGNLYVADQYNNCIRKITPAGVVSTFAGNGKQGALDGPADSAEFSVPTDVTVDLLDNVYVADNYNSEIRKITPSGVVSTLAGSVNNTGTANGTGAAAEFVSPQAVTIDGQGNIYETDGINNSSIRKITSAGVVTTLAGNVDGGFMNGPFSNAMFSSPSGLAVDTKGNIYVADQGNNMIRKITLQ